MIHGSEMRPITVAAVMLCAVSTGCVGGSSGPGGTPDVAGPPAATIHLPGYVLPKRPVKRVLVLVHGLTGDGRSTWTSRNKNYWPNLMATDATFEDFNVYVYEYRSGLFGPCLAVTDVANNLRLHLTNDRVFEDHQQVVFLAHSMGGIVVRQFLLRNRDLIPKVPLVLFFATPTAGSRLADRASILTSCSQVDDLRTLDVNSYLKSQVSDWLSSGLPERVISRCAFEIGGAQVVDRSSATLLCTKDPDSLPTNHSDAVKPDSVSDESHIVLRTALRALPSPNMPRADAVEPIELKKQIADLQDRLDQRFRNRSVREQLAQFVLEGDALRRRVQQGPPTPLPEAEANDWYARTRRYLRNYLDASYEARFVAPDPGLPMSYGLPKEYENLLIGILQRLDVLRRFLDQLRD
jgi:pimeloyl-ACP methyl ester carboxylesterase